ncbi:mitochondrial ribosomal protein [Saccharata proteae CBS 121410]|uniref:37S ribosomal protein S25, mitochondrial n=1 Tax=Saccharata proteae CBS 121410 TaxID=1314787 RepID=A0A9P4HQG0_9PEZI|nr:mitochondrial ribosomal protein [Saccharata proteae CBS 121410]
MGRHNFDASRVHQTVSRLMNTHWSEHGGNRKAITRPPPWFNIISDIPPSETLVRPLQQASTRKPLKKNQNCKKPSKMFQPIKLSYEEDRLRREFFADHPWELARPRVVLENDGCDGRNWDWSRIEQPGKKLDGESVVQRQRWLMTHQRLPKLTAYDIARKEFYALRHREEIERRIAREEALHTGAYFGKSALDVGTLLENQAFEEWRVWAANEVELKKQAQAAMYTGTVSEDAASEDEAEAELEEGLDETMVEGGEVEAKGGAMVHP